MDSQMRMSLVVGLLGALTCVGAVQAQPQTGPGVQSPRDSKYAEFVAKNCKNPPAAANFPTRPPAPRTVSKRSPSRRLKLRGPRLEEMTTGLVDGVELAHMLPPVTTTRQGRILLFRVNLS